MEALLLGLSSGSYCIMACAPVAVPLFMSESMGGRRNAFLVVLFLAARLFAYLCVGALLGLVGAYTQNFVDPALKHLLVRGAAALSGVVLIAAGVSGSFGSHNLCKRIARFQRTPVNVAVVGFVTGLSVCPPFFAAASRVFGGADPGPVTGLVYFALFFAGTVVWFLPLLATFLLTKKRDVVRSIFRMAMIFLGVYFLVIQGALGVV